jgi:hypothetical protein
MHNASVQRVLELGTLYTGFVRSMPNIVLGMYPAPVKSLNPALRMFEYQSAGNHRAE